MITQTFWGMIILQGWEYPSGQKEGTGGSAILIHLEPTTDKTIFCGLAAQEITLRWWTPVHHFRMITWGVLKQVLMIWIDLNSTHINTLDPQCRPNLVLLLHCPKAVAILPVLHFYCAQSHLYHIKSYFGQKANFENLFVFCKYALLVLKSMTWANGRPSLGDIFPSVQHHAVAGSLAKWLKLWVHWDWIGWDKYIL